MYKRARLLVVTALLSSVVVAGCGGSGAGPTPAPVGSATLSTSSTTGATAKSATPVSTSASSARTPNALAFARCMRANGVPNVPDPIPGGGFAFDPVGIDRGAPAVKAAQAKCQPFAPQPPGGPSAGSSGPPSAQALAQLRTVARCMREHGISAFPDPQTSAPRNFNPGEYSNITNYEGVFLLFPASIDMQSPAWEQAAAACGPLAESFNHPHH
jgi:hypothetical protein